MSSGGLGGLGMFNNRGYDREVANPRPNIPTDFWGRFSEFISSRQPRTPFVSQQRGGAPPGSPVVDPVYQPRPSFSQLPSQGNYIPGAQQANPMMDNMMGHMGYFKPPALPTPSFGYVGGNMYQSPKPSAQPKMEYPFITNR